MLLIQYNTTILSRIHAVLYPNCCMSLFFFLEAWLRDESGRRIWGTVDSHQALGGEGACLQASLHLSFDANSSQFVSQF